MVDPQQPVAFSSLVHDEYSNLTRASLGLVARFVLVLRCLQLLADASSGQVAYGGYRHAIRAIWRDEGLNGFYKGMSASYWGCSEGCIYFVMYERLKRWVSSTAGRRLRLMCMGHGRRWGAISS